MVIFILIGADNILRITRVTIYKMKTFSIKPLIRRFILATQFTPFVQIYRAIYSFVIHLAVILFKRYSSIKAIYLGRVWPKEEIVPGVSDIDFLVVVEGMDEQDREELYRAYRKFARVTVLPDPFFLGVFDEETFYEHYKKTRKRYRGLEAKATCKLLYGNDYFADLPSLPLEEMYGGFYNEIKIWWTVFCWRLLQARKNHNDAVIQNNVCYKTVSEILKMNLALNHGILTFVRSEALSLTKSHLSRKERAFIEKLEIIAQKHFRDPAVSIVEETKDFLIGYLNHFYGTFPTHTLARPLRDIRQIVDCSQDEVWQSPADRDHVEKLIDYVKEKWTHTYRGAYLGLSAYFHLDEVLLMVEVDPQRLPTVQELTALYILHSKATQPQLSQRIHFYLLMPHAAFQIDADFLKINWQSILCPPCNPDLYELLGRSEFKLDGGRYQPFASFIWTPLVKDFLQERKRDFYDRLKSAGIYKLSSLDFLRVFWKTVQLVLIDRSVKRGQALYPLTLPAIERAMAVEGISLPSHLETLAEAYRDEIKGKAGSTETLIPEAITYLKDIEEIA